MDLSDMSVVWADLLKKYEKTNIPLFAACSGIKDVEFLGDSINLYVHDKATHDFIAKSLPDYITCIYKNGVEYNEKVDYLKSVLGDKLVIK